MYVSVAVVKLLYFLIKVNSLCFGFLLVELLDEEEFGEDPERSAYDENATNTAKELGLLVGILFRMYLNTHTTCLKLG